MAENNGRALIVKFANTPFSIANTTDYYDTNEQSFMTSQSQACPYILTSLNTTNPWSNNNNSSNGCLWTISPFKQQHQPLNGWCISVGNLPPETSEHVLWEYFGLYGQVQHVSVTTSKETWCCHGSVVMTSCDDAAKAIRALNGFVYGGRVLQVSFF